MSYDKYYQTENLFGNPYSELIEFFSQFTNKGKVLDVGCGQGRDAIPLAKMGFSVVGIDNSKVGIEQMNHIAQSDKLNLKGLVLDIYKYTDFSDFDFVLLDSMFHFEKKDKLKEINFVKRIVSEIKLGCVLVICIQDSGKKVKILNEALNSFSHVELIENKKFIYHYEDKESGHHSKSDYRMIAIKK